MTQFQAEIAAVLDNTELDAESKLEAVRRTFEGRRTLSDAENEAANREMFGEALPKPTKQNLGGDLEVVKTALREVLAEQEQPKVLAKATMNRKEAAAYIGVSVWTLDKLRRRGLVKACGGTRHPKYTKAELDRYLRDNSF